MRALTFIFVVFLSTAAFAGLKFPELTGRVVDDAHILSQRTIQALDQELADYENGTTNQVVVVTLPSLQGDSIEDFGYKLGRHWQIGQKDKNNGALLIVAPREHKVRIEVGYGLEPVLTDAISSEIINGIILPDFKSGKMEEGVVDGTQAMISVLGGKSLPSRKVQNDVQMTPAELWIIIGLFVWFWLMQVLAMRHPLVAGFLLASRSSRFGSSGLGGSGWGSGGGGFFSGGGGSFGGGGSSGGW